MPADRVTRARSGPHAPEPLIGRDRELALIRESLDASTAGRGAILLLVGEPGMGKTALLGAATAYARADGIQVLHGAGTEVEGPGFSGLTQAVVPLMAYADRLNPAHHKALSVALGLAEGRLPQLTKVSQAVLALLKALSAEQPIVLIADDIQWLDTYSAEVLSFVADRVAGSRVAILAASRSSPLCPLGRAGFARHDLAPLDAPSSDALLRARFPTLTPGVRRRLLDAAAGNPLALLELPPALSGRQRAALQDLPTVLPLSERLQAAFASRIARLPSATRDLLLLAALDTTADLHVLRAAAGVPVLDDLAHAERERLVDIDDEQHRMMFRHPLTRSAVVGTSTAAQRRLAHRELARALTDRPEQHARHLAASADQPDEAISAQLERCADRMIHRGDAAGAIAALTWAADLSPTPGERSRRLAAAAQTAARGTWELAAAKELIDQAQDAQLHPAATLHAAAVAAIAMVNEDHDIDALHRRLVAAIETNARAYDAADDGLMAALATLSVLCLFGDRPALWKPYTTMLARLSPAVPQGLRLQVAAHLDPARTALPVLDELDAAIATLDDRTEPDDLMRIPTAAIFVDRLAGCRETLRRQISGGQDGRAAALATVARVTLWPDAFAGGRWDEAEQLARDGLATCTATGAALYAQICKYHVALLAAARGDADSTDALTTELIAWATPRGARLVHVFGWHARALAAIGRQDYEEAYQNAAAISPAGSLAAYEATALRVCWDLVEAAVQTNRRDAAQAHVTAMYAHDLAAISPRLALVTHGSAAVATADDAESLRLFNTALAVPGAERWPFDHARVQLAHGERLHQAGATDPARRHLNDALTVFETLGARPWVTRAGKHLRALGVEPAPGRPAAVPTLDALTPQELQIAELAAAGYTNKEIGARLHLSPRTASTHLYRVFPKLGVTSRAALRDALTAAHKHISG